MKNWFSKIYHSIFPYRRSDEKSNMTEEEIRIKEKIYMLERQIKDRGVRDEKVLAAVAKVPRHIFVPETIRDRAYMDGPLPIGKGQTISQPYIVAFMTEALRLSGEEKILEIGTGCGYQTAVLAEIAKEVYSIEIVEELGLSAKKILEELGYANIHTRIGDGYFGWPEEAPFDKIIITAAPHKTPEKLFEQLKIKGTMVVPVGSCHQELKIITKTETGLSEKFLLDVRFVPMTGEMEKQ